MGPPLPGDSTWTDQSKECLVDKRRGLQRVIGAFAPEARRRASSKLLIDERHQIVASLQIATFPGPKQSCDRAC